LRTLLPVRRVYGGREIGLTASEVGCCPLLGLVLGILVDAHQRIPISIEDNTV